MFNFNSKDAFSLIAQDRAREADLAIAKAQAAWAEAASSSRTEPTIVDPKGGIHGNVNYWYDIAQIRLKAFDRTCDNYDKLVNEYERMKRIAIERGAIDAGHIAIIRAGLNALREKDPNHPLLDKSVRDRIFMAFEKESMDIALKQMNMEPWSPRERPNEYESKGQ